MTTKLDKVLKRELELDGQSYILAFSPEGLKITIKGRRKGQELSWRSLIQDSGADESPPEPPLTAG
jgi:hypothetical protein